MVSDGAPNPRVSSSFEATYNIKMWHFHRLTSNKQRFSFMSGNTLIAFFSHELCMPPWQEVPRHATPRLSILLVSMRYKVLWLRSKDQPSSRQSRGPRGLEQSLFFIVRLLHVPTNKIERTPSCHLHHSSQASLPRLLTSTAKAPKGILSDY